MALEHISGTTSGHGMNCLFLPSFPNADHFVSSPTKMFDDFNIVSDKAFILGNFWSADKRNVHSIPRRNLFQEYITKSVKSTTI